MQALAGFVDGHLEVRNVAFNGTHSLGMHGNFRLTTCSPESTAVVDYIDMRAGGRHYEDAINTRATSGPESTHSSWSTSGITGAPGQEGTMLFSRIQIGGWPDNGLYVRGFFDRVGGSISR